MVDNPSLVATYRLQLTPAFGLHEAAAFLPYLARLGISHVYTSSYIESMPGSRHGYDTADHAIVSEELGGEAGLAAFHQALRTNTLGHVVDIVPNHMSIAIPARNQRWWNVLQHGRSSADASFFDIDWDAPGLDGKVLVPMLAGNLEDELAAGTITLDHDSGDICVAALRLPTAPCTTGDDADVRTVLDRQHYRLACWREATDHLSHRRFFDISSLIGLRVEAPEVFAAVHERTLGWVGEGIVQGLRIDHPDGLRDPTRYMRDLRRAAPDAWIVVEKILEPGERLPSDWPVDGTTGYDAMASLTGVFIDPAAGDMIGETFAAFVNDHRCYGDIVAAAKQQVVEELFRPELERVVRLAVAVTDAEPDRVRQALVALLVAMPVYRTYVTADSAGPAGPVIERSAQDDAVIATAVERARDNNPDIDARLLQSLGSSLRGTRGTGETRDELIARFQQLSGPVMAKGVEDTVFYRAVRLLALNEVGSDPGRFGLSVGEFHTEMAEAARRRPRSMVATSTHDTKRSEDVRARIALLAEVPDEWAATVWRWRTMNESAWAGSTPQRSAEYLLYQTLVGAHPLSVERTRTFLTKALREAKEITSWTAPTAAEDEVIAFAERISRDPQFQDELDAFVTALTPAAHLAAISQLTLKAMTPGVPDFYQGSELLTTSLADPDNRGEVDWELRTRLIDEIASCTSPPEDPQLAKLWLTRRLLQIRRLLPAAFVGATATYRPVPITGARADDAVAFLRGDCVLVIVPVRPVSIDRFGWADSTVELPPGHWIDALGGVTASGGRTWSGRITVGDVTATTGVAVLCSAGPLESDDSVARSSGGLGSRP